MLPTITPEGRGISRWHSAYMAGVARVARRLGRGRFVTIFNDLGERYFSTRLWD